MQISEIISQYTHTHQRQGEIWWEEVVDPTSFMLHHSDCHSTSLLPPDILLVFVCPDIEGCNKVATSIGKDTIHICKKSYQYLPSSSRKTLCWMDIICLVYIGYWQHYPEIESSSKLECIYRHEPLAAKCKNYEIYWKFICFHLSIFAYIHSQPLSLSISIFASIPMSKNVEKWVCFLGSLANPFTKRGLFVTAKGMQVIAGQLVATISSEGYPLFDIFSSVRSSVILQLLCAPSHHLRYKQCFVWVFFSSAVWYIHSGTSYSTLYRTDMPIWRGEPLMPVAMCGEQCFWSTTVLSPTDSKSHNFQTLDRLF